MQLQEAVDCLPTLLVLDNLHLLCPAHSEAPDAVHSTGTAALTAWLCNALDSFREQPQDQPPLPGSPVCSQARPQMLARSCKRLSSPSARCASKAVPSHTQSSVSGTVTLHSWKVSPAAAPLHSFTSDVLHTVVVCATCPAASDLAVQLRAPGRLDFTVTLAAPGSSERASLLHSSLSGRNVSFADEQLQVCLCIRPAHCHS